MPREMFVRTIAPVGRARSGWTIAGSLVGHAGLIVIVVVVPIVSGASGPDLQRRIDRFVMAVTPPPPPVAAPPPATRALPPEIRVNAAPVASPEGITLEQPIVASGAGSPIPGALPVGTPGVPHGLLGTGTPTVLSTPPVTLTKAPLRVGGDIRAPARLTYAPPTYPPIAITARVDGTVVLEAVIDESGAVRDVRVLQSIPLLDAAAVEAVKRWRYTPTRLNGTPVAVLMTVKVTFTLR